LLLLRPTASAAAAAAALLLYRTAVPVPYRYSRYSVLAPRTVPVLQACLAKTTGNLITKKTIEWGSGATYGRCNMHKRCVIVLIWCTVCPMSYDS
jgi:hypothetical protein